ncbi:mucin-1 [Malurus melanocephalus]|uniref:mucin-1 n=1 Tax=Malurus melanocephalus TaxID=175006 RepID=UPI0025484AA8|nr:mucin-1 [Malurus melanocephalus]
MAFTALLLLLVLGTGARAMTTETTMEMETTETTTMEMTTETSTTTTLPPNLFPKSTGSRRPQTFPYATVFPGTNTTNFHFGNSSTGSAVSNHTVGPVLRTPAISHINVTSNSSSWVPHFGTNSSSAAPTTSTCTCRRKSRGKLDLLSQKDSYHPMAEYLQYQSHGRYVSPNSKPNPYSQVAGSSTTRAGTFTYTNPASGSDNL